MVRVGAVQIIVRPTFDTVSRVRVTAGSGSVDG